MNAPNCPPPADWDWAKDGTWLLAAALTTGWWVTKGTR